MKGITGDAKGRFERQLLVVYLKADTGRGETHRLEASSIVRAVTDQVE